MARLKKRRKKKSKKLSNSSKKVVKKLSKSCQKVVKKFVTPGNKNSETGRRRRRRRFVVPRPGATLSHLVKTLLENTKNSKKNLGQIEFNVQYCQ
jgi:hypothetical protein